MITEQIEFSGGAGASLSGTIYRPDAPVLGSILMAHCFTCSQQLHTSTRLARRLVDGGYQVMTFDFTGLGDSGGDFADTTVTSNVADITRAAVTLIERDRGPCALIGHSLGGAASVLAAGRLHRVTAVVAIASPASVDHVRHLIETDDTIEKEPGRFLVSVGGRPFTIGQEFLDDLDDHDVRAAAASLDRPFLVVEAGADTIVGPDQTRALAESGNAAVAVVEGADHLFSDRGHADELAGVILTWLAANQRN